jgi:hypothetical protein
VTHSTLSQVFALIQDLVTAYEWEARYSWNAAGDDAGLHCQFVCPGRLVLAEVTERTLSPEQQRWLTALQTHVPHVEVYSWCAADREAIRRTLTREISDGSLPRHQSRQSRPRKARASA